MSLNAVTELRNKLEISQEDLSDLLGIEGQNTISRWERGHRKPIETIRRLVCLLNDLPKKDALDLMKRLGQYKMKKR